MDSTSKCATKKCMVNSSDSDRTHVIACRCLYYMPVTPDFRIVRFVTTEEWIRFIWGDKYERIRIIQRYIRDGHPAIREVSWIDLDNLTDNQRNELIDELNYGR